jgi:alpha-L-fucosidase
MKRITTICLSAIIASAVLITNSCREQSSFYIKSVTFPVDATPQQKTNLAARVVPTPQQLAWQQMELTAFIHFGINTFTGREWGDGTESPALFNPEAFDARQWVRVLQEGGMKMLILTAKHHDGFCLWPTATTGHSVAASPWQGGKGDVVKEVKEACDAMGMKFGVYLSPWDRNAHSYGDSPRYNEMFRQQLTELLTNYGRIDEVWFDGACGEGPNGKRQEYDWASYYGVISRLQPDAVTAIKGEDVRWVGTETGYGRSTEWSVTAFARAVGLKWQRSTVNWD